jgi:hypothetical protein
VDSVFCILSSFSAKYFSWILGNMNGVCFTLKSILEKAFCILFYLILFYFISSYFICDTRVWTQDFTFARQALYHLSHASSPFCSSYFEIESHFLPRTAWTVILPFFLSFQHVTMPSSFPLRWGLGLAWNLGPPDLSLPSS